MVKENTNKALVVNSLVLYGKMFITTICALLTTRFALKALGITDFGLYSVLGGIISFINIFNTIMVPTSNRFIAVAIGKGNVDEANKQFNVNLSIHALIAICTLIIALPLGYWYIHTYVNYEGDISNAIMVFTISIVGAIVSFVGVPYHGLLIAKERFFVFSIIDVVSHVIRLIVAYLLVSFFTHKLAIYTTTIALMTAMPTIVYLLYCSKYLPEIVRLRIVKDKAMYKTVFGFSGWVAMGAIAMVAKNQGASLIVNTFFNTVMNAAMGISHSINTYVSMFANNVTHPMLPQITKSYAAGNRQRTDELLIMSTKYAFLVMLIISAPFLVDSKWILELWLGEVSPYAEIFVKLMIIDNLVFSLNAGISNLIFASGKIKSYQIMTTFLHLLSIVLGVFVLKMGAPAYGLIFAYIMVSVVRFFAVQWVLHKEMNYPNSVLFKKSYLPSVLVFACFCPCIIIEPNINPFYHILFSFVYLLLVEYFIGLGKKEQKHIVDIVMKFLHHIIK